MAHLDQKPLARTRRPARLRELNPEGPLRGEISGAYKRHSVNSSPSTRGCLPASGV